MGSSRSRFPQTVHHHNAQSAITTNVRGTSSGLPRMVHRDAVERPGTAAGRRVAAGIYFARVTTRESGRCIKMLLLR